MFSSCSRSLHRSVRPQLLNIKSLDRRTAARKAFDALVAEIEHDLGGREQLSAIEKSLIQAYAGSAILLDDLNARVVLGDRRRHACTSDERAGARREPPRAAAPAARRHPDRRGVLA